MQAIGAYDGEHAVWQQIASPSASTIFVMKEWDARTGRITTVGGSHRDAHGNLVSGSWEAPVISAGRAAWVEGLDDQGEGEIVVLDLATRRREVLYKGHPGWFELTPRQVIWSESMKPDAQTIIRAVDLDTGKPAAPPAALARARGAWAFKGAGQSWFWVAGDRPTLYSASGDRSPVVVAVVPDGGASPPLAVAGGLGALPVSAGGTVVFNVRNGAWTYDPAVGWAQPTGNRLLILSGDGKVRNSRSTVAMISARDGAALTCR